MAGREQKNMIRTLLIFITLCFSTNLSADIVTTPTDLDVGDQYRLVFVTSGRRDATSTSIADYNQFVDSFGDVVLDSDWRVIGSTETVSAIQNTNTSTSISNIPIYRLDDTRIADDYAELWSGNIKAPINTYETGGTAGGGYAVATGTGSLGSGNEGLELGSLGSVRWGRSLGAGADWISAFITSSSNPDLEFYGISEVLTVAAVPEPASTGTLALALGCVFVRRRRRCAT